MAREITALRLAQQQYQQQGSTSNSSVSTSPETGIGMRSFLLGANPSEPNVETMLEAMRRENEQLRSKLVDTERDYVRISRLNEVYREELIEHRKRASVFTAVILVRHLCVLYLVGFASGQFDRASVV
jgi:hypothetical protein